MKQLRAILKDLQDSGQAAAIVGHFAVQLCHLQGVMNANDVRDQPETAHFSTDGNQNPNRYTTEHEQNGKGLGWLGSTYMTLPSDLVEVISVWANLPDSIKIGIVAMVKAAFESAGGNPSRSSAAISSLLKDLPEIP